MAEILGVNRTTANDYVRKGYIPFVVLPDSSQRRFRREDIEEFIKTLRRGNE